MYEEIGEGADEINLGGRKVNMRAYCGWFNFKGGDQQKRVSVLSGGERNRLQLAKARHSCYIQYLVFMLVKSCTRHHSEEIPLCSAHRSAFTLGMTLHSTIAALGM